MDTSTRRLKPRVGLPLTAALCLFLLIDTPRLIPVGPTTASGAITIALALCYLLLVPMTWIARWGEYSPHPESRREPLVRRRWTALPLALTLFTLYAGAVWISSPTITGLQNISVYTGFALSILLTATFASAGTASWALPRFAWAALLVTVVFVTTTQLGVEIYGERSFAAIALVFLAVLVPMRSHNIIIRLAPYLVLLAIVLSLSRTAAVIGLALLVFLVVRRSEGNAKRLAKGLLLLTALASAGIVFIWSYAPFRERFFGGDNAVQLGNGLTFNTSGRDILWSIALREWRKSPVFGNGAGATQEVITPLFNEIAHPHNEYLRILNDFGIVGLLLLSMGLIWVLFATLRRALAYDAWEHWSAFIALLAILALAYTDNPFIYQFVMFPLGVLVGLSLASPPPAKGTIRSARPRRLRTMAEVAGFPYATQQARFLR